MSQPKPAAPYSEALFAILITVLTPLFLGGPTGNTDLAMARAVAIEVVNGFRIRSPWDLFTVVQIVGYGVAAFGSLCLSMAEDMPVNTVLRCRYNANGLQRSSDRAQDRLDRRHVQQSQDTASDIELPDPEEVLETFRQVAEAQRAVAQAQAQLAGASEDTPAVPPPAEPRTTSEPARKEPAPKEPATPAEPRPLTDMQWNTLYAGAMATVAAEFSQEMHHLSPAEQKKHRMRIAALTSVSQDLSRGSQPVAWTLPGAAPAGQTAAHYHRSPLR